MRRGCGKSLVYHSYLTHNECNSENGNSGKENYIIRGWKLYATQLRRPLVSGINPLWPPLHEQPDVLFICNRLIGCSRSEFLGDPQIIHVFIKTVLITLYVSEWFGNIYMQMCFGLEIKNKLLLMLP